MENASSRTLTMLAKSIATSGSCRADVWNWDAAAFSSAGQVVAVEVMYVKAAATLVAAAAARVC